MANTSSVVHSLPYPTIEEGNFSFPDGVYNIEHKVLETGSLARLMHKISGAHFFEKLIKEGQAKFGCLVSVPKTGYRKLLLSETVEQTVSWDFDIVGEPPMLRPLLLYVGDPLEHSFVDGDGVAKIWLNKSVLIPKGARLARGSFLRPNSSLAHLLILTKDPNLKKGSFKISVNTENGFDFKLEAATDIFIFLKGSGINLQLRRSILAHAVSRCLEILSTEYGAKSAEDDAIDGWEQYSNLVALSDWLMLQDMPHWSDDNFSPELVATQLYPLLISDQEEEDE